MSDQFSRSRMLLGDGPQERLFHASVALFGVGGVGGFCAEALARAGIGALDLYDDDTCLLYTSPSPRDRTRSRMPSSA